MKCLYVGKMCMCIFIDLRILLMHTSAALNIRILPLPPYLLRWPYYKYLMQSIKLAGGLLYGPQTPYEFQGIVSQVLDILASIIQSSAVGPVTYVISASDLTTLTTGNSMHKYADDTYIVILARNAHSREAKLNHVTKLAQRNNLNLIGLNPQK